MLLSLVLATIGRSSEVGRLIDTLVAQTCHDFELLVVDQNTDDRLLPYLEAGRKAGIRLQHLRMDRPSLSGARNLGIARASGTLIGFPDDDCWYEPDTVEQIRTAFLATPELAGVIACWQEQSQTRQGNPAPGTLSLHAWRCFRGGDASSISLFFRRELFDRLGGFDERLGIGKWYGAAEETDFILRALASGARLDHCPAAKVHHLFPPVQQGSLTHFCQSARQRARGTGAIYAKHRLDNYVILRGWIAPLLVPLMRMQGMTAVARGAATILGRMEGFFCWKLTR